MSVVAGPVTAIQRAALESKPDVSRRQGPVKGSPGVGTDGLPPSQMSGGCGADGCGCFDCARKIASATAPVAPLLRSPTLGRRLPGRPSSVPVVEPSRSASVAPLLRSPTLGRRLPGRPSSVPVVGPSRSGGLAGLGRFERMYGADLSDVRVHDDADSRMRARAYGARAFTVGNDIYLDGAASHPGTPEGDRVVAHELAHVLQLRKGRGRSSKLAGGAAYRYPTPGAATSAPTTVSQPGDPIERDADAAADAALAGRAHDLLAASAGAVYRAATTGCIAPSEIVNVATASAFGHVAEALIEFNYCSLMGCSPFATDFFDASIGAAPYIAFLAAHNAASPLTIASWAIQAGLSGGILIPDILTDRPGRKDYYEIKPNSIDGRPAGMAKLAAISAFMSFNSLPYVPGISYTPSASIPIPLVGPVMSALLNLPAAAACGPIIASLEVRRLSPGLIGYRVCFTADWACWAAVMAFEALVALLILIIIETAPVWVPALGGAAAVGAAAAALASVPASAANSAGDGGGGAAAAVAPGSASGGGSDHGGGAAVALSDGGTATGGGGTVSA